MPDDSTGPQSHSPNSSSSSSSVGRTPIPEGLIDLLSSRDALHAAASTVIMAPMQAVLRALMSRDLGNLSQHLLELIQAIVRGEDLRRIFEAFGPYIAAHPEQVAGLVIGIVRGANPLALAGFGLLGLVVPAAWQASFGNVVASLSLVTFLQSAGMPNEVAVPLTGGLMVGAAAAAAALTAKSEVTRFKRAKL
ncbi:hypothetical protein BDZ89DRAFT_1081307 [Hymenopellis radicata]|nr:hypothetical protein BDZ89DRAFT_1081307 [Hymenopellis radicata]